MMTDTQNMLKHDIMALQSYRVMDTYQRATNHTAIYPKKKFVSLVYLLMKLSGEADEASQKFAKAIRDDAFGVDADLSEPIDISLDLKAGILDEVGDVLWYCAQICEFLDVDMNTVAVNNLKKLQDRQSRGVLHGSGDNR